MRSHGLVFDLLKAFDKWINNGYYIYVIAEHTVRLRLVEP